MAQDIWKSNDDRLVLTRFSLGTGRGIGLQLTLRQEHTTLSRGEALDFCAAIQEMCKLPQELFK